MTVRDTYAWTSLYGNADPGKLCGSLFRSLYGKGLRTAQELTQRLAQATERPEFFFLGNFNQDRAQFVALCRDHGINFAHWEDGFFPHYQTQHLDPLGFCWESSLPGLVFRASSARQRERARSSREAWLARAARPLPPGVRQPFVLWPLQLIGDQVNKCDLNLLDWTPLIRDFRARLPAEVQLVLKPHPIAGPQDVGGLEALVRKLPGTVMVARETNLDGLLRECQAVAGANSSVLYEARLMHHKPAYAYSRSWFTNHTELFVPLIYAPNSASVPSLPRLDWLECPSRMRTEALDDYTDWFLAQLLVRQIDRRQFTAPALLREAVWRLSDQAYRAHGEAIFDP